MRQAKDLSVIILKLAEALPVTFFIIFFAWISFFSTPFHDRYFLSSRFVQFVFLLILFCFRKKDGPPLASVHDWPVWVFLLCLLAGLVNVVHKSIAFQTYYAMASSMLLAFYFGKAVFLRQGNRGWIVSVICLFVFAVSMGGLLETRFAYNPLYVFWIDNIFYQRYISYIVRPMSTLLNPAALATYLVMGGPFAVSLLKRTGRISKTTGFLTLAVSVTCLMLTCSRAAFAGLVGMFFFYLVVTKDRRRLWGAALFLTVFLCMASFFPYPLNRFSLDWILIRGTALFSDYREIRFDVAMQMFRENPFFGIGFNHYRELFDSYYALFRPLYPQEDWIVSVLWEHKIADNMYLTLLSETGLVGTSGFLILVGTLLFRGLQKFRKLSDDSLRRILLLSMSGLVGFLFNMTGYEALYWPGVYLFFCLLCGLIQGATLSSGEVSAS